jgi:L-fuconolactonase
MSLDLNSMIVSSSDQHPATSDQHPVSRIDSHQHFWKFDPVRDAWISDDMKVIQRDFLPGDLESHLKQNQFDGCVSVQADQSDTETHFLLELAQQHDFINGVVGWVDLQSPNLHAKLESLSRYQKLKGFRHIVQAEPDGFLHQPAFRQGIRLLKELNYTYDILIYPRQFEDAIAFVNANPDQSFVIDHLAKPLIREGEIHRWSRYMKELAQFPQVYCKLSGMVTEADWKNWRYDDFIPYMETTLAYFGAGRVMYGSDWPVCLVAATFDQQLGIVERFISTLSASEKKSIMGGNAIRFYNL